MEKKTLRKSGLVAALLLSTLNLSACVVAPDRDGRGNGRPHHHWNNDDRDWNGAGWQGNGGGWNNHH